MSQVFVNAPCPFLPETDRIIRASEIVALGQDRGPGFYEASLRYGQSLWRTGLPAQALLQCNRALATFLAKDEPVLQRWPLPYKPMVWLLVNRREGQFLGNPRRHFQHLATRMTEPHKELRIWRAWACWYLSKMVLPEDEFPADWKQIRSEGVVEPVFAQISERLQALSPAGDEQAWLQALEWSGPWHLHPLSGPSSPASIVPACAEQLPLIRELAFEIWPRVYPGIISEAQIGYMLELRYNLDVLRADMEKGVRFALVMLGGQAVGFTAFEPRVEDGEAFLHKLYLLPEMAGQGFGAQALEWVTEQARLLGLQHLKLFVNKHNAGAIRAYLRNGFIFHEDKITDIGDGFVMDDYVMVKEV